ncbi:hypothetical protein JCM10213_002871 [Rhodosporidiobolus nylandii]
MSSSPPFDAHDASRASSRKPSFNLCEAGGKTTPAMEPVVAVVSARPDLETGRKSYERSAGERRVHFSAPSACFLAFIIMSTYQTWAGVVATSLYSGGPVGMVYGFILVCCGSLAGAASLAEMVSMYPSAEGQILWAQKLAPAWCAAFVRYYVAWATSLGWTCIGCSAAFVAANSIVGVGMFTHPEWVPQRWQTSLILWAIVLLAVLVNLFAVRYLGAINTLVGLVGIATLVTRLVLLPVMHDGPLNSASYVFAHFINETGWDSDGVAFFLGLVGSAFSVIGYDAVAHLSEEMAEPAKQAPMVMLAAAGMSFPTGLPFIIVLLFVIKDTNYLATLPYPFIEIAYQAVKNKAGAVFLTFCVAVTGKSATHSLSLLWPDPFFFLPTAPVATMCILTTVSRVVWAHALEGGIPFSSFFAQRHPRLDMPVNALCVVAAIQCLLSLIYIGNTALFNSILTLTVAFLNVSYAIPTALMLFRGRPSRTLPNAPFRLGPFFGPLANSFALVYQSVVSFFLFFPTTLPTKPSTMNWACVIVAGAHVVLGVYWFVGGRKAAHGVHDTHELRRQETEGGGEEAAPKRR